MIGIAYVRNLLPALMGAFAACIAKHKIECCLAGIFIFKKSLYTLLPPSAFQYDVYAQADEQILQ